MLRFYYGTLEKNIDITQKVAHVGDYIVIPADDNVRAGLFTDPCFRTVKHILIAGLSNTLRAFDHTVTVIIDERTNTVLTDQVLARRLLTQTPWSPSTRAKSLHRLIDLTGGTMMHEFPEQCMALQFLKGDETVLEIGGNIGRNSLIMSSILDDSRRLVVLECSPQSAATLTLNRDRNGCHFQIEASALSARPLVQKGWNTMPSEEIPEGYTRVPTLTYSELQAKYALTFDTLVLDCEGAFYYILTDFPEILTSVKTIITENDYRNAEHKKEVERILLEKGFRSIYKEDGGPPAADAGFQDLDQFYQVWQRRPSAVAAPPEPLARKGGAFMDKYPHVFFFRYDKYAAVDALLDVSDCSVQIINEPSALTKMTDPNYPILVTFGDTEAEYHAAVYSVIQSRMRRRWIHYKELPAPKEFVRAVNHCYIDVAIGDRVIARPTFSLFTTCFNSYDKIERAYKSIAAQTLRDWEWIILDDSPNDEHFAFLRTKFAREPRVRLYRRSANSANIGNVKNEAVGLCRGAYALEMDHDDEILPDCLADATRAFEEDKEVGFVYMDFINAYEDGRNFWYGDFICLGYGGYYCQKYKGRWTNVYMTPNVNNITLSHIVALPNHPRIWRMETLRALGNYSEFLPICDDQEILMRTALKTKMVKIPKLSYVQYMNDGNNNFSLIRNREINRLGPQFIVPQFYAMYDVHGRMKELNAYEDEKQPRCPIWKKTEYEHKYCNKRVLYDYDTQYCILGRSATLKHLETIRTALQNPRNDFLILDNTGTKEELCAFLDTLGLDRAKCYALPEASKDQRIAFFNRLYKTCEHTIVLDE
jgi:FkbM family methyltransferase